MFKIELISPPTPGVRNPSMIAAASGAFRERERSRIRDQRENGNLMRRFDELAGQAGLLDVDDAVIDGRRNGSVAIVPLNALRRVGKMNKYLLVGMLVKEKFVIVTPHAQLLQKLR